ncbi:hypothetical protein CHS0354_022046 [Potamilus streckersoni]|uniref:Uncharacterized protein n=1 Tax=Potamilus streckersoni TaxID=2493646 RepID=A0AAE0SSX7_9BIVA|nr:hypothetical protein CHS0354_022046 [Potamilus streckersoni]
MKIVRRTVLCVSSRMMATLQIASNIAGVLRKRRSDYYSHVGNSLTDGQGTVN